MTDRWRMERLSARAEGRAPTEPADPGERLEYDVAERRLILYARDGSVRGMSARFDPDPTMPLTTAIERMGDSAIIRAWQAGEELT